MQDSSRNFLFKNKVFHSHSWSINVSYILMQSLQHKYILHTMVVQVIFWFMFYNSWLDKSGTTVATSLGSAVSNLSFDLEYYLLHISLCFHSFPIFFNSLTKCSLLTAFYSLLSFFVPGYFSHLIDRLQEGFRLHLPQVHLRHSGHTKLWTRPHNINRTA